MFEIKLPDEPGWIKKNTPLRNSYTIKDEDGRFGVACFLFYLQKITFFYHQPNVRHSPSILPFMNAPFAKIQKKIIIVNLI